MINQDELIADAIAAGALIDERWVVKGASRNVDAVTTFEFSETQLTKLVELQRARDREKYETSLQMIKDLSAHLAKVEDELQSLRQQLAVKDLEVMKLRSEMMEIRDTAQKCKQAVRDIDTIYMKANKALSTTFTPENLMAWYKEQLGEPVAWKVLIPQNRRNVKDDIGFYRKMSEMLKEHIAIGDEVTPLYAPKLEIK